MSRNSFPMSRAIYYCNWIIIYMLIPPKKNATLTVGRKMHQFPSFSYREIGNNLSFHFRHFTGSCDK